MVSLVSNWPVKIDCNRQETLTMCCRVASLRRCSVEVGLNTVRETQTEIYSATGANKHKDKLKIKVRKEQVASEMTDIPARTNKRRTTVWSVGAGSVRESHARQAAIGNDWQAVTRRLLFGTSSQLCKHYPACHTWQKHNWITSGAVCTAGATFSGSHGEEQITSAKPFFLVQLAVTGSVFPIMLSCSKDTENTDWHLIPPHAHSSTVDYSTAVCTVLYIWILGDVVSSRKLQGCKNINNNI